MTGNDRAYAKRYNYDRARGLPPRTMPADRFDLAPIRSLVAEFGVVPVCSRSGTG